MKRFEPWILAAWALLVLEVGLLVYLASAGPGAGPVRVYLAAPTALMGAALVLGVGGVAWSFFHRPFLRGPRTAALVCCAFVFLSSGYPIPFPVHREGRPSRVAFRLPVEGEWIAAWGGDDTTVNLLARSGPDRRFPLVLVPAEPWEGAAPRVTAPTAGTVVGLLEEPGEGDSIRTAVIEVAPDEYLFLGGLGATELAVDVGQRVAAGDPIGRIAEAARSLFTPEPHLALHLQDTPDPILGQGIPWSLHGVEIDGRPVEKGMPRGGGRSEGRWTGQRVRTSPVR